MFGWRSRAQARLSRMNRSRAPAMPDRPSAEDDLDRDFVAEQRAAGAIDRAHPAFGERRENLVSAVEDLPGREHGLNSITDVGSVPASRFRSRFTAPLAPRLRQR